MRLRSLPLVPRLFVLKIHEAGNKGIPRDRLYRDEEFFALAVKSFMYCLFGNDTGDGFAMKHNRYELVTGMTEELFRAFGPESMISYVLACIEFLSDIDCTAFHRKYGLTAHRDEGSNGTSFIMQACVNNKHKS